MQRAAESLPVALPPTCWCQEIFMRFLNQGWETAVCEGVSVTGAEHIGLILVLVCPLSFCVLLNNLSVKYNKNQLLHF